MAKEDSSYPSPTAAQVGNGAGPYPGRPSDAEDDMELRVQLSHEISQPGTGDINPNLYSNAHSDQDQAFSHHMNYGYQQTSLSDVQAHSMAGTQHPGLIANQHTQDSPSLPEDGSAKKKSKVTRACDECRRKKIKCDADAEAPTAKCTNCKRTSSECLFSKPAQKRGPSRGYIRDLSDRVADLEREKSERGGKSVLTPLDTPKTDPPLSGLGMRGSKRTHSMSEGLNSANGFGLASAYSQGNAPVAPFANMGFPNLTGGSGLAGSTLEDSPNVVQLTQEEDDILQPYFSSVHTGFPLISDQVSEIQLMLSTCTAPLRSAFFNSIRAVSLLVNSEDSSLCKPAYKQLVEMASAHGSRTPLANIVYLQSLALLIYGISMSGHAATAGPQELGKGTLYGTAADVISHLKLRRTSHEKIPSSQEIAIVHKTGRRALWLLAILDGWDAFGYNDAALITKSGFRVERGDKLLLGVEWYTLACMLSSLANLQTQLLETEKSDGQVEVVANLLAEHLDLIREMGDEALADMSVANLAFRAMKMILMRYRLNKNLYVPSVEVISDTNETTLCLLSAETITSPLKHHVVVLAATMLLDAVEFKGIKDEARKGLEQLMEGLQGKEMLLHNGWQELILNACNAKLDSLGGLQHLANAAVGATEGEEAKEVGINMSNVLMDGYLNSLLV